MPHNKNRKLLFMSLLAACLLWFGALGPQNVSANDIPAGCPGGPAGPASPGTVCPDGSTPHKDASLPPGCPGTLAQGPPAIGTVCPARPGRAACEIESASKCNPMEDQAFEVDCKPDDGEELNRENCGIVNYIVIITNALSALVGIVIVLAIVVSGIQYSAARENPQWAAAAKDRIREAIFALLIYIFLYAFLNWLIPGGLI